MKAAIKYLQLNAEGVQVSKVYDYEIADAHYNKDQVYLLSRNAEDKFLKPVVFVGESEADKTPKKLLTPTGKSIEEFLSLKEGTTYEPRTDSKES